MNEGCARSLLGRDRWGEALRWCNTLEETDRGDFIYATCHEWQDWYADAENRRIFEEMSRLLADRGFYHDRRRRSKAELEQDQYDLSEPIATWRRTRALLDARKQHSWVKYRWWLVGGVAVAAIAALISPSPMELTWNPTALNAVVYQTGIGGLKNVHLSDGSSIILGGRTRLSVAFSTQRRSVNLLEGQAWFKVTHNPHWPFIVAAGDGTIKDLGTAFLVTQEAGRVVVTVTEGTVQVSAWPRMWTAFRFARDLSRRPTIIPIRLSRGEQVSFGNNGKLGGVTPADTRAATAWTHGQLVFDDQPLRYVVEAINRYSSRPVVVSPSAGALRFSGIVANKDISDWLPSLQVIFPVAVDDRGASICIHMRATQGDLSCDTPP